MAAADPVSISTLRAELAHMELRLVQKLAEKEDLEKIAKEVEDRVTSLEVWRDRAFGVAIAISALGVSNFITLHL